MSTKEHPDRFNASMLTAAPREQGHAPLEELMLASGLMDDQLEVFTAGCFGVDHSKLRRLADKDPTLVPLLGRWS